MIDQRPLVDSREPEGIRTSLVQVGWLQKPLPCGDFSFLSYDGLKIGITRKSADDLLNSVGELFAKQLDEMLDYYDICFFLREGNIQRNPIDDTLNGTRHTYSGLENWLIRFYCKGFVPIYTANVQHTVKRLPELYANWQKPFSYSSRTRRWADEGQLALPSGTRGSTGEVVLSMLGSIQNVANASREQLLDIPGIGAKKAELIYNHFHKDRRVEYAMSE